jgi:hypothetical protein
MPENLDVDASSWSADGARQRLELEIRFENVKKFETNLSIPRSLFFGIVMSTPERYAANAPNGLLYVQAPRQQLLCLD